MEISKSLFQGSRLSVPSAGFLGCKIMGSDFRSMQKFYSKMQKILKLLLNFGLKLQMLDPYRKKKIEDRMQKMHRL